MRRIVAVCLFFGAVSSLPAIAVAQSGIDAAVTEDEVAYSNSGASAESPRSPAMPASAPARKQRPSGIGVGVRLSFLGIGGEVAVPLSERTNLRAGFNGFGYSRSFSKDGVNYAADLSFRSVEAHYDWYPFAGRLHLSPGLMVYNGNKVTASATVPGGQTFTLGGTQYTSDPSNPITGSGKVEFNKVAPTIMLGLGNLVPRNRKHFGINFEVGLAFAGAPQVTLNLKGSACNVSTGLCANAATDSAIQSNVASEQRKINGDVSAFKVYPVMSLGFSYRF